jgi:hypothetical protein
LNARICGRDLLAAVSANVLEVENLDRLHVIASRSPVSVWQSGKSQANCWQECPHGRVT